MPTFENVSIETKIDIEFEVYCGTCGVGLCSESDARKSYNRGYLQVTVNACPSCMKDKNDKIEELENQIEELNNLINKQNESR